MAQNKKQRLLWGLGLLGTAVFTLLMGWLHYQQLLSTGYYYSDIPAHMAGHAMGNTGFSLVTVLLRGVFAIGGNLGTAVLCCGALAWHIASGIVFLGLMLAGISYAVMIGTESYLLQEMWGIVL